MVPGAPGSGTIYVGGNIAGPAGEDVSRSDVWLYTIDGALYSLSGSARDLSLLRDGRDVTGASAGDEYGTEVQECVTGEPRG